LCLFPQGVQRLSDLQGLGGGLALLRSDKIHALGLLVERNG